ncbi:2-oxoglutarate and iron-dependent oxygenase JMJD4-like isoform X2 [Liolophura sinensis]
MTLGEYTQYWESYIGAGYPPSMESLYLKDWHFTRDFPGYPAYTTPNYFNSDWLNEFWDRRSDEVDDYRFVYMGPKGSWTPFHADVFRSFSWSANICGRKKWILFPPGEEDNLRDSLGNLVYDVFSANLKDVTKYPQYQQVHKPFEVYQEEGEIIYVPSGWHHQVHNMEDTISINHNWINGCNIDLCWTFLMENLADVQREIADCATMDGWNEQCQIILKASSGINFEEFFRFISTVATNRLASLKQLCTWKGKTHGDVNGKLLSIEKSKRFRKGIVENVKDDTRTDACANFVSCVSDSTYYDGNDGQRNDTKANAARHCTDACCSHSASGDRVLKEVSSRNHSIQATEGGTCGATISSHTSLQNTSCDFTHGVLLDSEQTKNDVDLDSSKSSPFSSTSFRMDSFHGSCHEQSMINQNKCQIIFDLQRLEYVLSAMLQKAEFSSIDFREYSPCPEELLLSLSQVFKK